jgi:hypothetical protein
VGYSSVILNILDPLRTKPAAYAAGFIQIKYQIDEMICFDWLRLRNVKDAAVLYGCGNLDYDVIVRYNDLTQRVFPRGAPIERYSRVFWSAAVFKDVLLEAQLEAYRNTATAASTKNRRARACYKLSGRLGLGLRHVANFRVSTRNGKVQTA